MDEDDLELDLTQVNMDIKAGVNPEAAVTGMLATAMASTDSRASNATGAAGAQTVVISRSGVTGANLAVGTQDSVTTAQGAQSRRPVQQAQDTQTQGV
jgi:hypothetical protein